MDAYKTRPHFILTTNSNYFLSEFPHEKVSSSIRPDPFPTIILEAFSLGIPIVATNMGGCEEMLDYDDRFLAQPNSISLSSKIEYMLKLDQYHREEIVNHNLSRMTNEYGFQKFRTNVLNIV